LHSIEVGPRFLVQLRMMRNYNGLAYQEYLRGLVISSQFSILGLLLERRRSSRRKVYSPANGTAGFQDRRSGVTIVTRAGVDARDRQPTE